MLHELMMSGELFVTLMSWDAEIAKDVSAAGCGYCRGPLYQSNYWRKPRGGLLAVEGEAFNLRHSLCCGRQGCRKRTLPPSLRFLGRRVYLEAVVVLASVWALVAETIGQAAAWTGVPRRTLIRWGDWWRSIFPQGSTWSELRARFAPPPPCEAELPASLVNRIEKETRTKQNDRKGRTTDSVMLQIAFCLAPDTTRSLVDGASFLRGVATRMQEKLHAQKM